MHGPLHGALSTTSSSPEVFCHHHHHSTPSMAEHCLTHSLCCFKMLRLSMISMIECINAASRWKEQGTTATVRGLNVLYGTVQSPYKAVDNLTSVTIIM